MAWTRAWRPTIGLQLAPIDAAVLPGQATEVGPKEERDVASGLVIDGVAQIVAGASSFALDLLWLVVLRKWLH